ncbi:MAG TPA: penicillin acylase family protein, partial [Beutenbergiaceae bacterium]|nr:penicillin acylase family protein [Beutenbergiaceae bacterium]
MNKTGVMRRVSFWVAVTLVVVLAVTTITVITVLRRPLPNHSGQVQLAGLDNQVEVIRDDLGIPHIYADSATDLFYAQGYVHAQDRFFEMDYRRHLTAGRMAELVGDSETAIAADKVIRTMGWRKVAEEEWADLQPETRQYMQAYSDGVNAYISKRSPSKIALEYTVLGMQVDVDDIEPWDPIDSLAWLKAMAWDLVSNFDDELSRATIFGHLNSAYGPQQALAMVEDVYPAYPTQRNLPIITNPRLLADHEDFVDANPAPVQTQTDTEADALATDMYDPQVWAAVEDAFDAVPHPLGEGDGLGSNSWVISGELTESGKPLLANDPHLGISQPGIWYQMSLNCTTVSPDCPF